MKSVNLVGLSMLAGAVLGGAAIQGLHAQAKPPVFAVIDIDQVVDSAADDAVKLFVNDEGGQQSAPPRRYSFVGLLKGIGRDLATVGR